MNPYNAGAVMYSPQQPQYYPIDEIKTMPPQGYSTPADAQGGAILYAAPDKS